MTDAIPGTHQLGALGSKTPFVLSEPREVDILVPRAGEEPEAGGSSWACQATGSEVGGLNCGGSNLTQEGDRLRFSPVLLTVYFKPSKLKSQERNACKALCLVPGDEQFLPPQIIV